MSKSLYEEALVFSYGAGRALDKETKVPIITQHSALSTQHSALSTQHSALSTQHSALSTQHSALSTQHSALSTQHSAYSFSCIHVFIDDRYTVINNSIFSYLNKYKIDILCSFLLYPISLIKSVPDSTVLCVYVFIKSLQNRAGAIRRKEDGCGTADTAQAVKNM